MRHATKMITVLLVSWINVTFLVILSIAGELDTRNGTVLVASTFEGGGGLISYTGVHIPPKQSISKIPDRTSFFGKNK